jgi:hypothetical protein
MVPLSERRHRLREQELPEVRMALFLRLKQLLRDRKDEESAEIVLRLLCRLSFLGKGRPRYPEFTWDEVKQFLNIYGPEELQEANI